MNPQPSLLPPEPDTRPIGHCWLCAGEIRCDTPEVCGVERVKTEESA